MPYALADLRARRAEILRVAAKYGARDLRVFGSVARGEQSPESDIDLLADFEPGRTLFDRGGLVVELSELLGTPVDVAAEGELRDHVREQARREAVAL